MSNRLYTQREVSIIFSDVPNKTLIYWARQGFVEWAAETRDARGIARLYNHWNLFQIGLVRELAGLGIPVQWIRMIMSGFKDFPPGGHHTYDEEGNEIKMRLPSEIFASGDALDYLVIIKKMGDRGWKEPLLAGTSTLKRDDIFKRQYGTLMKTRTTITINLSSIEAYVTISIKEAGLS
jgi:DNA-binding transcriptional MerR regulator